MFNHIPNLEDYSDAWYLIRDFLTSSGTNAT